MVKQVGYNASIAMTMTYDQQDAMVVQACKGIYKDAQNQIAQLMAVSYTHLKLPTTPYV